MGLISRFGNWLDRLSSEKATKTDIEPLRVRLDKFDAELLELSDRILSNAAPIEKLSEDNLKFRDELNAIKALYKIGSTQQQTPRQAQKFDGSQAWKR